MPLLRDVATAFNEQGVDLAALGLAWARAMPSVTIVPAFGLKALPQSARAVLALALAGTIFPALITAPSSLPHVPWALALAGEVLAGLPIAVAAAIPLWAAAMAGSARDATVDESSARRSGT